MSDLLNTARNCAIDHSNTVYGILTELDELQRNPGEPMAAYRKFEALQNELKAAYKTGWNEIETALAELDYKLDMAACEGAQ